MISLSFDGPFKKYVWSDVMPAASTFIANRRTKVAPSQEILTSAVGAMSSLKCSRATNCSTWGIADVDGGSNESKALRCREHSILRAGTIEPDLALPNLFSSAAAPKL